MKQSLGFGFTDEDILEIESNIVAQRRQLHANSLEKYEQEFSKAVSSNGLINEGTRIQLDDLRLQLRLRLEDVEPIELRVTTQIRDSYQKNLEQYEKELYELAQSEFPFGEAMQRRISELERSLQLIQEDIEPIKHRIISERQETYDSNLERYEKEFQQTIQLDFPLSDVSRQHLEYLRQLMGLQEKDVIPIETRLASQRQQAYKNNLEIYQQAFQRSLAAEYPIGQSTRSVLNRRWRELGLRQEKIDTLEARFVEQYRQTYQANLALYEQAFSQALDEKVPLENQTRLALTNRWRELHIRREDVEALESRLIEQYQQAYQANLSTYEEEFTQALNAQYPLKDSVVIRK